MTKYPTLALSCCLLVGGLGACSTQKTFLYDSYSNEIAASKVRASKKVWIKTVDCDNDLLVAELKASGFTIDRSQADYAVSVNEDQFAVTFNIYDGKSDVLIYSKVYFRFEEQETHEQFRAFIRQNLADFTAGKA
ncbi:MAG: hypothetical protein ABI488_16510 [Polyangiaceae bacterium]